MPQTINVLFLAAEADPFVKVGGLGDVAGTLPRAIRSLPPEIKGEIKLDVRLVLPLHSVIHSESLRPLNPFSIQRGSSEVQVEAYETLLDGMPVYFIGGEPIRASGTVYSSNNVLDGEKYTFFSLAALELPRQIGWQPNIIHANDWHTALAAYGNLVKRWGDGVRRAASVTTLHNLPFMGPDVSEMLDTYRLPLAQTDLPGWARVLPLPLGMWASDSIVAVSPTYAQEVLTPDFGSGLQDFLKTRRNTLTGILNGLDTASFNPSDDPALTERFTADNLAMRIRNKTALQYQVGLPVDPSVFVMGMVSRMDPQKGMDIAIDGLKRLANSPRLRWQAVVLSAGDPKLEESARRLQKICPERVRVETRFDAQLARQIYGGADLFLMPSRYEPCGLSQMIAMHYGCVPLVRAVGGLHDTVTDSETGFVFIDATVKAFNATIRRAMKIYLDHDRWTAMQKAGMAQDFSWSQSARKYFELYQSLVSKS